ncbi:MAG: hypothetical protein K6E51_14145 [Treponema sp.]|nr:hypothetical protein [Treponema sp.]
MRYLLKAYIVFFSLFFACSIVIFAQESSDTGRTIVTIKNAHQSGSKKNILDGSDIIVLQGNVVITIQKGNATTTISADTINYNRENDMIYAQGSVTFDSKRTNAGSETITANTLLFNTATLEGVFDDGRVVQTESDSLNLPSDSTLIVDSDVFGRDDSGTISFKKGSLTFCNEDPPHWKIKATRIWMLPGGEFAFFNAFVYVGNVPLLYLPGFWYPKDELVFNPVFGYESRRGYFIQTTTYLYGRKPLSAYDVSDQYASTDSDVTEGDGTYYSFVKPSKLKDQELQGLLLHNLDTDYTGDTTNYAKIMADWYSNLGGMVGFDSVYKDSSTAVSNFEGNLELGFSNTVFNRSGNYLAIAESGTIYEDRANFLGWSTPFRYSGNFALSVVRPFTLNISLPMYSDPFFKYDFGNRNETMDWIDYLISNPSTSTTEEETTSNTVSSFTWSVAGSYDVPVPNAWQPYVSQISITNLSSQMLFNSLTNTTIVSDTTSTAYSDGWYKYTPQRKFFYPSQINPIAFSGKISGTLFSYEQDITDKKETDLKPSFVVPLTKPDEFITEESPKQDTDDNTGQSDTKLPEIAFQVSPLSDLKGITYALTYSIVPSYTTEITYANSSTIWITDPDAFDWNKYRSTMYTVKVPTTLTSTLGYRDSFIGLKDSLLFNPVYQWHPYLSDDTNYGGYSSSSIASIKETDYAARKMDLTNSNTLSIKPFYYTEHFKNTGIAWNTSIKLVRTEFIGDADNPEWEYLTADVSDENSFTVHTLDLTLAATQLDDTFGQSLTLTTTLPPQVDEYYGTLAFTFPYTTLTFETGIKQKSATDDTWVKEDFKQALSIGTSAAKFTESYNYNLEEKYNDALKLAVSLYDLQLAYTSKYTYGYTFVDTATGWKQDTEKSFQPYSLSIAYASTKRNYRYWKKRITWAPSLSTSVVYDYIQPTNSYFKFIPSITFQINKFLNISFASESRNDVIYRYFQQYTDSDARISGETNILRDLFDSFRFDDESKRKASGFKLSSLAIKVTHELCDWDFGASFKVSPRLVRTSSKIYYDFSPYFALSVVWRPMSGVKTKLVDEYGTWELNP